jgi:type I restriction-modification system DNA methylase subunit
MSRRAFEEYRDRLADQQARDTEQTPRSLLADLFDRLEPSSDVAIVHEPPSDGTHERPDLEVERDGLVVGHVVATPLGAALDSCVEGRTGRDRIDRDRTDEGAQPDRLLAASRNLVVTNFAAFVRYRDGRLVERAQLLDPDSFEWTEDGVGSAADLLATFLDFEPPTVEDPERLADLLAARTRAFEDVLEEVLDADGHGDFRRHLVGADGLHSRYRDLLATDLERSAFVDAYVQIVAFGLLLARLDIDPPVAVEEAVGNVPATIDVLDETFETLQAGTIPGCVRWILDELCAAVARADVEAVARQLSNHGAFAPDPWLYFYEEFLSAYDGGSKARRGVYYTPVPVARFIVEGVEDLLEREFGLAGLGDPDASVLDFATGTGTFLLESYRAVLADADTGTEPIRRHLTGDFYGFENAVVPFAICHLVLARFLETGGYGVEDGERLGVFLADALADPHREDCEDREEGSDPAREHRLASAVKRDAPVLAVVGNPPYSIHTENEGRWIRDRIADYKAGLDETKHSLDDDYVKFLRFAQWLVDRNGEGVVGVVTNSSFLDGITHRGMRRELLDAFDAAYVLDLHGNESRGDPGENVFDVRNVGVAVTFLVKRPDSNERTPVHYASTLAEGLRDREEKYEFLLENDLESIDWTTLEPAEPDCWFVEKDLDLEAEYREGWSVDDIFEVGGSGVKTDRDDLFVDFDRGELADRMETLLSGEFDDEFAETYRVENTSSYPIEDRIAGERFDESNLRSYHYRPFDHRQVYYKQGLTSRPASKVMDNFIDAERNLALVAVRQVAERTGFNHVFVSDRVTDLRITTSNRGTAYLYPLYLDEQPDNQVKLTGEGTSSAQRLFGPQDRKVNFTDEFVDYLAETYDFEVSPEDVFCYIYGVFSSPAYREKYQEFLKVDYPHVQFVDRATFREVARLGRRLVELHTLAERPSRDDVCVVSGSAEFTVREVAYDADSETLAIDGAGTFEAIPETTWEFELGGYQVLEKWLSEREGRELTLAAVQRFQRVTRMLAETIDVMGELDRVLDP